MQSNSTTFPSSSQDSDAVWGLLGKADGIAKNSYISIKQLKPPRIDLERCCRHCECDWGRLWLDFKIYCSCCDKPLRWADPEIWLLRSDLWSAEAIREEALR